MSSGDKDDLVALDQKLRRALYLVIDRLDKDLKRQLHSLIDEAPEPIIGREPTDQEKKAKETFNADARCFLTSLPPESGITYQAVMEQVDAEFRKRAGSLSKRNLTSTIFSNLDHLAGLNQPVLDYESDDDSLGSGELFDEPKGPPPTKRLLAAAQKAREQAEVEERKNRSDPALGDHLATLNQPVESHDSDDDSLGSGELFDEPKGPPPTKRLLAAAQKAREQVDAKEKRNLKAAVGGSREKTTETESSDQGENGKKKAIKNPPTLDKQKKKTPQKHGPKKHAPTKLPNGFRRVSLSSEKHSARSTSRIDSPSIPPQKHLPKNRSSFPAAGRMDSTLDKVSASSESTTQSARLVRDDSSKSMTKSQKTSGSTKDEQKKTKTKKAPAKDEPSKVKRKSSTKKPPGEKLRRLSRVEKDPSAKREEVPAPGHKEKPLQSYRTMSDDLSLLDSSLPSAAPSFFEDDSLAVQTNAKSRRSPRKNFKPIEGNRNEQKQRKKELKKRHKTAFVDYLCIVDFMATCDNGPPPKPQEIIEFPAILLNVLTGEVEDHFHYIVKPDVHPMLSPFCTELTGITQEMVDDGIGIVDAIDHHRSWLEENGVVSLVESLEDGMKQKARPTFLYALCGDWDLKVCLPNQLEYHGITVPQCFQSWINLKWPFESIFHEKVRGIGDMMDVVGLSSVANELDWDSGLDECLNLARLCKTMVKKGWVPNPTSGVGRMGSRLFWEIQSRRAWPRQTDTLSPYKMVYLIRNGQAESEIANSKDRATNIDFKDCGLTERGVFEARALDDVMTDEQLEAIELVVTSPLKRAIQTSLLGFPNHQVLVHYDLADIGRDIPENSAKPIDDVLAELMEDINRRGPDAGVDHKTLKPKKWPRPPGHVPAARKVRGAFEWLYLNRQEQTMAVVCHYNVIRTAIHGSSTSLSPDNATPIKCQLYMNGYLVPV